MTQLNRKELTWTSMVGIVVGFCCGVAIGLSMFQEAKRCDAIKQENRMLQQMVMYYQNQPPCGE